jgi:hypothetical protein
LKINFDLSNVYFNKFSQPSKKKKERTKGTVKGFVLEIMGLKLHHVMKEEKLKSPYLENITLGKAGLDVSKVIFESP